MSKPNLTGKDNGPWYKQFWCWFILAPLLIIMIIWIPFLTVIVKGADDTVLDNYYKEGRAINERVDQDRHARELGLQGELKLADGKAAMALSSTRDDYQLPRVLYLYLDHPFEADYDQQLVLLEVAPGQYEAELKGELQNSWYVRLTSAEAERKPMGQNVNDQGNWRLMAQLDLNRGNTLYLGGGE